MHRAAPPGRSRRSPAGGSTLSTAPARLQPSWHRLAEAGAEVAALLQLRGKREGGTLSCKG